MKYLLVIIISFLIVGCAYRSPHVIFIDSMGYYISGYNDYEKEKEPPSFINDEDLVEITYDHNKNTLYHFNWDTKNHDCSCKYYIVVDKKGIIIGWGFNPCNREKCCRIVG